MSQRGKMSTVCWHLASANRPTYRKNQKWSKTVPRSSQLRQYSNKLKPDDSTRMVKVFTSLSQRLRCSLWSLKTTDQKLTQPRTINWTKREATTRHRLWTKTFQVRTSLQCCHPQVQTRRIRALFHFHRTRSRQMLHLPKLRSSKVATECTLLCR